MGVRAHGPHPVPSQQPHQPPDPWDSDPRGCGPGPLSRPGSCPGGQSGLSCPPSCWAHKKHKCRSGLGGSAVLRRGKSAQQDADFGPNCNVSVLFTAPRNDHHALCPQPEGGPGLAGVTAPLLSAGCRTRRSGPRAAAAWKPHSASPCRRRRAVTLRIRGCGELRTTALCSPRLCLGVPSRRGPRGLEASPPDDDGDGAVRQRLDNVPGLKPREALRSGAGQL